MLFGLIACFLKGKTGSKVFFLYFSHGNDIYLDQNCAKCSILVDYPSKGLIEYIQSKPLSNIAAVGIVSSSLGMKGLYLICRTSAVIHCPLVISTFLNINNLKPPPKQLS